jgi:hypothetical protein
MHIMIMECDGIIPVRMLSIASLVIHLNLFIINRSFMHRAVESIHGNVFSSLFSHEADINIKKSNVWSGQLHLLYYYLSYHPRMDNA